MNSLDKHYKTQNVLTLFNSVEFPHDHPIEEVTRLLFAVIIKHLALGPNVVSALEKGNLFYFFILATLLNLKENILRWFVISFARVEALYNS